MDKPTLIQQLIDIGLNQKEAFELTEAVHSLLQNTTPEKAWHKLSQKLLCRYPFKVHLYFFSLLYPHWHEHPEQAPAWIPDNKLIQKTNIARWLNELNIPDVKTFHHFTVNQYQDFWRKVVAQLQVVFKKNPEKIFDLTHGLESPQWFPGAKLNISDSCFTAASSMTAVVYQDPQEKLHKISYGELNHLANRIAASLTQQGFSAGDAIAIDMPMTVHAIVIYLGIIKMGGVVVGIADSFSSQEIAIRLHIAKAKAIFTQDFIVRGSKKRPLYEKIQKAKAPKAIVLACEEKVSLPLRAGDRTWDDFLIEEEHFNSVACDPMQPCNILFSSGTTTEPKAIPWNHTTPIKAASDAFFHQNIQPNDVLAWPTSLGWMMGPWLIFAALLNHATIALYPGAPKDREFGKFVQQAGVTMLGVVPTLVAHWRQTACMEGLDWHTIKVFSSTGECSNAEDMLYLMYLAEYKPIIEYCGGTEIGGGYITSTVVEKNYPSLMTTAAMGINFLLIDEKGHPTEDGEVALIPPSIGLSTELLNADHHQVYYANMPKTPDGKILRRHGDQIKRLLNGTYCVLGRVDDTMNIGGIKVSAVEIERALAGIKDIIEVAAVATTQHGPSQLIIYAATKEKLDAKNLKQEMQQRINNFLNPLYKIHEVVLVDELPKTASNKIMRRVLRESYSVVTSPR